MKKYYLLKVVLLFLVLSVITEKTSAQDDGEYHLKKICIDPGHGGKDPGALGKSSKEKDICLAIALKLGNYINEYIPDVEVVYTRKTDIFVTLMDRTVIANNAKPDLFISIHINSCNNKKAYGASTYVVGRGKETDNLNIALEYQENGGAFSVDSIDPADKIALQSLQKAHKEQSTTFAGFIQKEFGKRAKEKDVKEANFAVLWRAQMPAVLVECSFISTPKEENFLKTEEGQKIYASAIYRAIKSYGYKYDKNFKAYSSTNPPQGKTPTEKNVTQPVTPPATQPVTTTPAATKTDDIFYKVQLKSSTVKISLDDKSFKGIQNIEETKTDGVYKYTVGKSKSLKEITNLQNEIRKKIPDAFVIAVQGSKRIDMATAKKLLQP
ncbi:MAG: N-acetylmuramoyl-L-alanine amidase [Bacteroidales bacterium]|nr:N-acetylmuramoyl-L-alanine amidase [Bacteroidales bacterium]